MAEFLIIERGDTLADSEDVYGRPLIDQGTFAMMPELAERHRDWIEITFILSDDGFGLVLLVAIDSHTDPSLHSACERALASNAASGVDQSG